MAIGDAALPDELLISPQTTGDLIGRAIRVYRRNMLRWAPLLILPTVVVLIGRVIYHVSAPLIKTDTWTAILGICLAVAVVLTGKWWLLIKLLSFVRLTTGFASSLQQASVDIRSRKWQIAGIFGIWLLVLTAVSSVWILELIAATVLLKVIVLPALLAVFLGVLGFFMTTAFLIFALFLSFVTLACEKEGVSAYLSRGFGMATKSFLRTLVCGIAIGITVNALAMPLWIPVSLAGALDAIRTGNTLSSATTIPIHWQVMLSVWETLIEMITQPIYCLAFGFYYYDLRLRFEGIDLTEALANLKLKQPPLLDLS